MKNLKFILLLAVVCTAAATQDLLTTPWKDLTEASCTSISTGSLSKNQKKYPDDGKPHHERQCAQRADEFLTVKYPDGEIQKEMCENKDPTWGGYKKLDEQFPAITRKEKDCGFNTTQPSKVCGSAYPRGWCDKHPQFWSSTASTTVPADGKCTADKIATIVPGTIVDGKPVSNNLGSGYCYELYGVIINRGIRYFGWCRAETKSRLAACDKKIGLGGYKINADLLDYELGCNWDQIIAQWKVSDCTKVTGSTAETLFDRYSKQKRTWSEYTASSSSSASSNASSSLLTVVTGLLVSLVAAFMW